MSWPWVSRAAYELIVGERDRALDKIETLEAEKAKLVDTLLVNGRMVPVNKPERAAQTEAKKIPKRLGLVDVQRRLEARERG